LAPSMKSAILSAEDEDIRLTLSIKDDARVELKPSAGCRGGTRYN
jgi:hypothetical protein